jgi:hypothetical protein
MAVRHCSIWYCAYAHVDCYAGLDSISFYWGVISSIVFSPVSTKFFLLSKHNIRFEKRAVLKAKENDPGLVA